MDVHNIVLSVMFGILALVGLVGNAFLIFSMTLSKKLRTTTNAFVFALSLSDILNSTTFVVQVVALAGVRSDVFLKVCAVAGPASTIFIGTSAVLLTLIAICRFILITRSTSLFSHVFSPRLLAGMIAIAYLFPTIGVTLSVVLGLASAGLNEDTICTFYDSSIFNNVCAGIIMVCLAIVCFCYLKIYIFLRRHFKQLRDITGTPGTGGADNVASNSPTPNRIVDRKRNLEVESKINKNMVIVVCAFVACMLPMSICLFFSDDPILGAYCFAVMSASSCCNPALFGWKHPVFHHVFRCILKGELRNIEEPATWLRKFCHRSEFS
ncbi:uncharacterized protein [Diadema antillarum]|uniref:uncharacterized protein n=1 Tax=Diadema antillarum TaxID=105358 RepID=UPI003A89B16A